MRRRVVPDYASQPTPHDASTDAQQVRRELVPPAAVAAIAFAALLPLVPGADPSVILGGTSVYVILKTVLMAGLLGALAVFADVSLGNARSLLLRAMAAALAADAAGAWVLFAVGGCAGVAVATGAGVAIAAFLIRRWLDCTWPEATLVSAVHGLLTTGAFILSMLRYPYLLD